MLKAIPYLLILTCPFSIANGETGKTLGRVIPGVSVSVSPTCASVMNELGIDPMTGIQTNAPRIISPATYSLFAQMGAPDPCVQHILQLKPDFHLPMPAPRNSTNIQSWASVIE